MVEQTYRVDMIPNGVPLVVHVSQYDTEARTLIFELYKGDVAYEVPAGAVASIAGTKPDKTAFIYPMVIDDNVVSIDLKQQMAIVAGDVLAEIQITNSSGKIGSANFVIRVERGPIDEDSVISETDLPIFEQLVSDAQEAASDAQTAADTASTAASSVASIVPASSGTAGQVLTKTATGADWRCPFPIGFGGFFKDNPSTIYAGTTWEQKKDVFILAAGDTYSAGSTGGEAQHKLTVDEMPNHSHQLVYKGTGTQSDYKNAFSFSWTNQWVYGYGTVDTGGGAAHNNMPPYFAMPFWIRTA